MSARDECIPVDQVGPTSLVLADGGGVDERDDCEEKCTKGRTKKERGSYTS